MVEARTVTRKILLEDVSIAPKVNSNPPSPEPEGPAQGRREGPRPGPRKEEAKRRESERIRPQADKPSALPLPPHKSMSGFLAGIEEAKQSSPKRANCSCGATES